MMSAQKRMEEALAQQTILDLARKVGRKSPAEFPAQVDQWINEWREKNAALRLQPSEISRCAIFPAK
jgi:hypothetical protein